VRNPDNQRKSVRVFAEQRKMRKNSTENATDNSQKQGNAGQGSQDRSKGGWKKICPPIILNICSD